VEEDEPWPKLPELELVMPLPELVTPLPVPTPLPAPVPTPAPTSVSEGLDARGPEEVVWS